MNCARNYENMLNFVKVMPKILLVPFFRTRCSPRGTPQNSGGIGVGLQKTCNVSQTAQDRTKVAIDH